MSDNDQRVIEALFRVEAMSTDVAEIKTSMKDMAKALERLVVVEERQSAASAALGRAFSELDKHETRISELERAQPLQKQTASWVMHAISIVMTAVVTSVVSMAVVKTTAEPVKAAPALIAPR